MSQCVTSSLIPYQPAAGEWSVQKVAHLYRSAGYGATASMIQDGLMLTPTELVDQIISSGINATIPEDPIWAEWTFEEYDANPDLREIHIRDLKADWLRRTITHGFHQKMTMFWHDHFAAEKNVYVCNSYAWKYYKLLNQFAFGNFRSFVEEMGLTEAILVYLNGNLNVVGSPNENYARELMELFTMGEGNGYTQLDIAEVAKALTGYRVGMYECNPKSFDPQYHDDTVKTIFGQTGNFNYDDVHEMIFTLRSQQIATYICTKLYQFFVYNEVDENIVAGMAETFINSNWEVTPVITQLLKSEHFFENVFIGSKIKSPVDLISQLFVSAGFDVDIDLYPGVLVHYQYITYDMGLELLNPPNVAGWPGNRFWLNENSLAYRWSHCHIILNNYMIDGGRERLRQLAIDLSESISDPAIIASSFVDHFLSIPLEPELKEVATLYLKAGIPENYFDDGSWNLNWDEAPSQVLNLLKYIVQLPEYQLT